MYTRTLSLKQEECSGHKRYMPERARLAHIARGRGRA